MICWVVAAEFHIWKESKSVYENPIIQSQKSLNFESNLDNLLKLNQRKNNYPDFDNT